MASLEELEINLEDLKNIINSLPIPFIFNLDEFGQQDYADPIEKTVLIPITYQKNTINCTVNRSGKRASCLACISPLGIFAKSQIAVSRVTVDSEIFSRIPKDSIQIVNAISGYINTYSFIYWMESEFLLNLKELPQKYNYFGPSVLIINGYLSHKRAIENIIFEDDNLIILSALEGDTLLVRYCDQPHKYKAILLPVLCGINELKKENIKGFSTLQMAKRLLINQFLAT